MFHHILVPLDGSNLAETALPHAVAFARVFDARITLLRVVTCPAAGAQQEPVDPVTWEIEKSAAAAYLDDLADPLQEAGLNVDTEILEGQPAKHIVDFVRADDVDCIVLSTHGMSGLTGWNVSSVVQKVIQRVNISVLLVRAYRPAPSSFEEITYEQILVPLDGSKRAEYALPAAKAVADAHSAKFALAFVVPRPQLPDHSPPSAEDEELVDKFVAHSRENAQAYVEAVREQMDGEIDMFVVVGDDIAMRLHDLADAKEVDLVVMTAHGQSGKKKWPYGSVTTNHIFYGSTALLIVQDLPADTIEPTSAEIAARETAGH